MKYSMVEDAALRELIAQGRVTVYHARLLAASAQVEAQIHRANIPAQIQCLRFAVDVLQWAENAHESVQIKMLISAAGEAVELFGEDELERSANQGRE
jgi:hypothetical protein